MVRPLALNSYRLLVKWRGHPPEVQENIDNIDILLNYLHALYSVHWAPRSLHRKQGLNWFSLFCTAQPRDGQTDWLTDTHPRLHATGSSVRFSCFRCGLKNWMRDKQILCDVNQHGVEFQPVQLSAWKADIICSPPLQRLWSFPPLGGPLLATARSQWPRQERGMNFQCLSVTRRPYWPSVENWKHSFFAAVLTETNLTIRSLWPVTAAVILFTV